MCKTCRFLAATAVSFVLTSTTTILAAEPVPPAADANQQLLLETIRANRTALIAVNLHLSDDESAKFWPIYDRYEKEINAIGDRVLAIIDDYEKHFRELSDEKALQLIKEYLDAEAARVKVRQSFLGEFAKALPGRTVTRFYQIENKMDAIMRYDLAAAIPVVEPDAAAPAK